MPGVFLIPFEARSAAWAATREQLKQPVTDWNPLGGLENGMSGPFPEAPQSTVP